jgi:hypothetical protein
MDGTVESVFKESHNVGFSGFLKSFNGGLGDPFNDPSTTDIHDDLFDKSLEGSSWDQEVNGLLILADFPQSSGSWSELVWLAVLGGRRHDWLSGLWGFGRLGGLSDILGFVLRSGLSGFGIVVVVGGLRGFRIRAKAGGSSSILGGCVL